MASGDLMPLLSIVVPVYNEAGNITPLVNEIEQALHSHGPFEIIYVNDGSKDETATELRALQAAGRLRMISHKKSCGQSAAMQSGIRAARAPWVVTLDGDGQNDPADIPALLKLRDAHDKPNVIVMGYRWQRQDSGSKKITSKLGNAIRRAMLKDGVRDTGCSLKLFRRDDFLALPFFDHIHRYIPALLRREGVMALETPVNHRPRTAGVSKYGFWDRLWVGIADILGVYWLLRRRRLPEYEA